MRALVIQHDHVSPPGAVGLRLVERGAELVLHQVVPAERHRSPGVVTEFPDVASFDVVVAMGAPWSVYDEAAVGSWVGPELELLRRADRLGVPVLGLCFGGQLLAAAHGGSVLRAERAELGWTAVETDDAGLVPAGPWFEWHIDRWELPPGAREIARTGAASQAFVVGRNLAVQFHPELDAAMLRRWLDAGGAGVARDLGHDPAELLRQTLDREPAARRRAALLVDAFLERVAATPHVRR